MLHHIHDNIRHFRVRRHVARSRYRDKLEDLPDGLYEYWSATASQEFKGIRRDALFFVQAAERLIEFFDCVAFSGKPCGLPSKAADSVWHAWLRHAPMTLQQFCLRHFQRLIPHLEALQMAVPLDDALAVCLVASRRLAGLMAGGANLPPLFAADTVLRMPHGVGYRLVEGRIGRCELDGSGRRRDHLTFPPALQPAALVAAGLVQPWEIQADTRSGASADGGSGPPCDSAGDGGCGSGCGGD